MTYLQMIGAGAVTASVLLAPVLSFRSFAVLACTGLLLLLFGRYRETPMD